jgi:DNA-binding transcriptional ArsR family regulator
MDVNEIQAEFFKAIAHPLRIKILNALKEKNSCVCDMAKFIGEGQPQVSRALAQLKQAGIVMSEKTGTKICYRLKSREVVKLLEMSNGIMREDSEKVIDALSYRKGDEQNGKTNRPGN